MKIISNLLLFLVLLNSCAEDKISSIKYTSDSLADRFVFLALSLGELDADYVDAYFGKDSIRTEAKKKNLPLRRIKIEAIKLLEVLDSMKVKKDEMSRKDFLFATIRAMNSRINHLLGYDYLFDQEAKFIYNARPPHYSDEHFDKILKKLDELLPGKGDILSRYEKFRENFIIPEDKVDTVFRRTIQESRKRTKQKLDMLDGEYFTLEYVTGKSWSGYNWYQGNAQSLVQINLDQPVYIDRAIDIAAHEGYPGHHTFHSRIEAEYVKKRKWSEFTVYPLFSPMSLLSEGLANFGIEVVFPGNEKILFEKEVLFPLAGISSSDADKYYKIQSLVSKLNFSRNEAARNFLDGKISEEEAIKYSMKYSLMSESRAKQSLSFVKKYRAYVINYNYGLDLVRKYISHHAGGNPEKIWEIYTELISNPHLPSDLIISELK
jgi:hypothetical protein